MRYFNYSFILLCLTVGMLNAQPTLTKANNAYVLGEVFYVHNCAYQNPGSAGSNQIWNFNAATTITTSIYTVKTPTNSAFTGSNVINIELDDSLHHHPNHYYTYTNDTVITPFCDYYINCGGYHISLFYPFNMGDSLSKTIMCSLGSGSGGLQNYKFKYDGFGTIILPNATYNNVLRIVYSSGMPQYTGNTFQGNRFDVTYVWYLPGYHYPIAKLKWSRFPKQGPFGTVVPNVYDTIKWFQYIDNVSVSIKENSIKQLNVKLYPNPVNDTIFIEMSEPLDIHYTVYDLFGKEFSSKEIIAETKNTKVAIDVSELINGTYFIKIKSKDSFVTKKFCVFK